MLEISPQALIYKTIRNDDSSSNSMREHLQELKKNLQQYEMTQVVDGWNRKLAIEKRILECNIHA